MPDSVILQGGAYVAVDLSAVSVMQQLNPSGIMMGFDSPEPGGPPTFPVYIVDYRPSVTAAIQQFSYVGGWRASTRIARRQVFERHLRSQINAPAYVTVKQSPLGAFHVDLQAPTGLSDIPQGVFVVRIAPWIYVCEAGFFGQIGTMQHGAPQGQQLFVGFSSPAEGGHIRLMLPDEDDFSRACHLRTTVVQALGYDECTA